PALPPLPTRRSSDLRAHDRVLLMDDEPRQRLSRAPLLRPWHRRDPDVADDAAVEAAVARRDAGTGRMRIRRCRGALERAADRDAAGGEAPTRARRAAARAPRGCAAERLNRTAAALVVRRPFPTRHIRIAGRHERTGSTWTRWSSKSFARF